MEEEEEEEEAWPAEEEAQSLIQQTVGGCMCHFCREAALLGVVFGPFGLHVGF